MILTDRDRLRAAGAGLLLAAVATACASGPTAVPTTVAPPGCRTSAATVHVVLSARSPVPVVRTVPGGCVAVTVPGSPFRHTPTDPTRTMPAGRLRLVSDSLHPDGTRVAYYTAIGTGAATITSTVSARTDRAVPEWSAVVVIV